MVAAEKLENGRFSDVKSAKKCPADGHFGVAQSPEPPLSETLYTYPNSSLWQVRNTKKFGGFPVRF
jgi:hypothetical protein